MVARYEDKRWIPRHGSSRSPSRAPEETTSEFQQRHNGTVGCKFTNNLNSVEEQRKPSQLNAMKNNPVAPEVPSQVIEFIVVGSAHALFVRMLLCMLHLTFSFQAQGSHDRLISISVLWMLVVKHIFILMYLLKRVESFGFMN